MKCACFFSWFNLPFYCFWISRKFSSICTLFPLVVLILRETDILLMLTFFIKPLNCTHMRHAVSLQQYYQYLYKFCRDYFLSERHKLWAIQFKSPKEEFGDLIGIQLCDCLSGANGVIIMEKRMTDVVVRHGFNDFTVKKWASYFALKEYFDKLCETNIYNLFYDEIKTDIFGYDN